MILEASAERRSGSPCFPLVGRHKLSHDSRDADSREEEVVSLLFRTSIRLQAAFDRCFLPFAMTAQEAAVLVQCVDSGEISAGKLAHLIGRDKAKITRFVDRLEKRDLLARRGNKRDQRLCIIAPTNRGRRVAPHLKMVFGEIRKKVFAGMSSEDSERLASILTQLCVNAEHLRGSP